jgi:hypothetical protein
LTAAPSRSNGSASPAGANIADAVRGRSSSGARVAVLAEFVIAYMVDPQAL